MYVAVVAAILGQALLFGDVRILEYALFAWLVAHLFVLTYEEPTLRKTFGAEYESLCANVRRWIPRATPWRGDATNGASGQNTHRWPRFLRKRAKSSD